MVVEQAGLKYEVEGTAVKEVAPNLASSTSRRQGRTPFRSTGRKEKKTKNPLQVAPKKN